MRRPVKAPRPRRVLAAAWPKMQEGFLDRIHVPAEDPANRDADSGDVQQGGSLTPGEEKVDVAPLIGLSAANRTKDPDVPVAKFRCESQDLLTARQQHVLDAETRPEDNRPDLRHPPEP